MNPESTGLPADSTRNQSIPLPAAKPAIPTPAKLPSPSAAAPRISRTPGAERMHQQQPRRNYDAGISARAAREHGRGRHGR